MSLATGCGPKITVDTKSVVQAFQGSPAQAEVTKATQAVDKGDYAAAVPILTKVARGGQLTQEQKDALTAMVTSMQMIASQNEGKYTVEVYNSMSDLAVYIEGKEPVSRLPQ